MPNVLHCGAIFHAFPFPHPPFPSVCFDTPPLLLFLPRPSPFPRRWTRNLAIADRTRSAMPWANVYYVYAYVSLDWPDGRIMFSTCPFFRSSVRSFVCYQLVDTILRKRKKRLQCKLAEIFPVTRARRSTSGSGGQRSRSLVFESLAETSVSTLWVE